MEQHPIPQNVSSYQFKLVGDMTLKQFFQLAGGLVVALIFYSSPLIAIVKWPFVIISALLGAGMAFLPFEERPLEVWIISFFKSIYSPTMFFWKKTTTPVKYFQDEPTTPVTTTEQEAALKNYTAASKNSSSSKFDFFEQSFLSKLSGLFAGQKAPVTQAVDTNTVPVPEQIKKPVEIPQTMPTKIAVPNTPHLVVEEKPQVNTQVPQATAQQVSPIIAGNEIVSTKEAIFSLNAAPPSPPTIPNTVVGQVVDDNKRIVEGAIMEIRDETGRPVRALRSNKVGHFITVTPLDNGRYNIVTDKEGYQFSPAGFEASGSLIPPILIQGKITHPELIVVTPVPKSKEYTIN